MSKRAARAAVPAKVSHPRRWSNTWGFVLALAGAAIGFKTIWGFPYVASQNGGGAFLLIYVLLAFVVGAPLLIAQVMIGRRAHASPITAMQTLSAHARAGRGWVAAGVLAVLGGFIAYSSLSVIAGWSASYFIRTLFGVFTGLTADGVESIFAAFIKDPEKQMFWHSLFVGVTMIVVGRGVSRIEATVKRVMPAFVVLLIVLTAYAMFTGNLHDAAEYLFTPDFSKLTGSAWVAALSQVFFSFGLGTGIAIMYGAYVPHDTRVVRATLAVVGLDMLIAVAVGVAVLALVLGGGLEPTDGPTLVFQILPLAFDHLPMGRWFATMFFALLVMAALLAAIGLVEPAVAWMIERFDVTRTRAAAAVGLAAWALGLVSILSVNVWAFSFKFFEVEKQLGMFDVLQILTAQLIMPLAALLLVVFAGWWLSAERARDDLELRSGLAFNLWLWLLRLVVPAALLLLTGTVYTIYA
jgi:neurotransmitter:Na+ symporter, NSS family